jgi:hypothetical protein
MLASLLCTATNFLQGAPDSAANLACRKWIRPRTMRHARHNPETLSLALLKESSVKQPNEKEGPKRTNPPEDD